MKPLLLCILDGIGINKNKEGNASKLAKTPNLDKLFSLYPSSELSASGEEVGLPKGLMGNSEVGHTNIGSGRVVYQGIELINQKINDQSFYTNDQLVKMINFVKEKNTSLHLIGLVSDGGVHSSINHIQALIDKCDSSDIKFYLHIFTDGRDTLPNSSLEYIKMLDLKSGQIASISGRYYAMDRDNRYERIEQVYDVLLGLSDNKYSSVTDAIKDNYNKGITDEFIQPGMIKESIKDNDGVIFFNFRPDRLRELASALIDKDFNGFERKKVVDIKLLTMLPVSNYDSMYQLNNLPNTLGEYISEQGLKQLRIAETEKYAHVTYFFDGGKTLDLPNCKQVLIPSPKVATYDLKPEMSAYLITDELLKIMDEYDFIVLNFANGDMVGHTGDLTSAIKAVEVVDECIGKIVDKFDGILIITSDHGNCEQMTGDTLTSHTTNKVKLLINQNIELKDGKLADIAPTILKLLNLDIPKEMTGEVLISR